MSHPAWRFRGGACETRTEARRREQVLSAILRSLKKCPRLWGLKSSFPLRIPKALVFVLEGMEFLNGVKGTERVASNRFYLSFLSFRINALQWAQRCSFNQKLVLHFLPVLVLSTMSTGQIFFFALQSKKAP